jgi:hypothetical protein
MLVGNGVGIEATEEPEPPEPPLPCVALRMSPPASVIVKVLNGPGEVLRATQVPRETQVPRSSLALHRLLGSEFWRRKESSRRVGRIAHNQDSP